MPEKPWRFSPHAVRWARRELKLRMRTGYTKWHWAEDAHFTVCGISIPVGLKGTLLPDCCDWLDIVDCKRCKVTLEAEGDG